MNQKLRALVECELARADVSTALQGVTARSKKAEGRIDVRKDGLAALICTVIERIGQSHSLGEFFSEEEAANSALPTTLFRDEVTGLDLIPVVIGLYRNRPDRSVCSEEFLRKGDWAELARNKLVYSELLRRTDPHLYMSLDNRARSLGIPVHVFFFSIGIMSRKTISTPPEGFERQANLMKRLRAHFRAEGLRRSAFRAAKTNRD